jgi:hypothetical protein
MNWFWLNVPAGFFFVAAWSGVPFWLVLRHPDWVGRPPDLPHPDPGLPGPAHAQARPARPLERI